MSKEQKVIEAMQKLIIDEYELAIHWHNLWCRQVAERENKRSQKALNHSEKTHYELYIVITKKSFNIYWRKVTFIQRGIKKQRLTEHVPFSKNKNVLNYYTAGAFRLAGEWESELIFEIERRVVPIRNRLQHISAILRSLTYYNKSSGNAIEYKLVEDLIDLSLKRSVRYYKERG